MKGFPNQVSDLEILAGALHLIIELVGRDENPRDDGAFGEALIREGVLGTGHTQVPVDEYLAAQKAKKRSSDRSCRTRARQLRELFRILGLIDDSGTSIVVTPAGRQIAGMAGRALAPPAIRLWRSIILNMIHDGGDGECSHPYQVLLRLVARKPGITRAKCALALEARNDMDEELERIVGLADLPEDDIRAKCGVLESNWNNAKKILPRFAEQLGDVQKLGHSLFLSDAPGIQKESPTEREDAPLTAGPRKPRSSTAVTAESIARAGTAEHWDEAFDLSDADVDPEAIRARSARVAARLKRHNVIVRKLARILEREGAELFENPFDCLACFPDEGLLIEVKSLDGTDRDEVVRVREALGQLLYYESFVTKPLVRKRAV